MMTELQQHTFILPKVSRHSYQPTVCGKNVDSLNPRRWKCEIEANTHCV